MLNYSVAELRFNKDNTQPYIQQQLRPTTLGCVFSIAGADIPKYIPMALSRRTIM